MTAALVIDIVILIILLISVGIAVLRGFVRETLTIIGVGGGLAAAYYFGPMAQPSVQNWFGIQEGEDPQKLFDIIPFTLLADAVAYGGIFLLVVIILSVISHFLAETIKAIGLGPIDRTLGIFFGLVRGAILVALPYTFFFVLTQETPDVREKWFGETISYPYLESSAKYLSAFLPEETVEELEKQKDAAEEANRTRETLQEMNLLQADPAPAPEKDIDRIEREAQQEEGYQPRDRQNMNNLIEQMRESQ